MAECVYCRAIESGGDVLYSDDLVVAMMPKKPWAAGHVVLLPKKHYAILEEVPVKTVEQLYAVANRLGVAVFQSVDAHGVNMVLNNGVGAGQRFSHVMIHIVARRDGDGLGLVWSPVQVSAQALDVVCQKLRALFSARSE